MRITTAMAVLALSVLCLTSVSSATAFTALTLDSSVSVGSTYNLIAQTGSIINYSTPCTAVWQDEFNNTVHTFTTDPDHNAIRLTTDGWVRSFCKIDDAFVVGKNYNMTLSCGNFTATQNVFIDTAGDLEANRMVANLSQYSITHPEEVMWGLLFLFIAFAIGMGILKKVRDR